MAWSVGMTATTVFLDRGPGFSRDHPPLDRRVAGPLAAVLAVASLVCVAIDSPYWVALLLVAPYTLMAVVYGWSWLRARASLRRAIGWQTSVIGGVAMLVLMLTAGPDDWNGGVVMTAYAASAGLLGGLTFLLIRAITAGFDDGMDNTDSPYGIPARIVGTGLAITGFASLDVIFWLISGHEDWWPTISFWLLLSLLVPGGLIAAGHKLYPRLQRLIWSLALLSAVGGQAAIHALTLFFPGLIPPDAL